jgi:hypothetical protein
MVFFAVAFLLVAGAGFALQLSPLQATATGALLMFGDASADVSCCRSHAKAPPNRPAADKPINSLFTVLLLEGNYTKSVCLPMELVKRDRPGRPR